MRFLHAASLNLDCGVAHKVAAAYWVHKFGGGVKLQAYAVKGISDGSPDWGVGTMFIKTFDK